MPTCTTCATPDADATAFCFAEIVVWRLQPKTCRKSSPSCTKPWFDSWWMEETHFHMWKSQSSWMWTQVCVQGRVVIMHKPAWFALCPFSAKMISYKRTTQLFTQTMFNLREYNIEIRSQQPAVKSAVNHYHHLGCKHWMLAELRLWPGPNPHQMPTNELLPCTHESAFAELCICPAQTLPSPHSSIEAGWAPQSFKGTVIWLWLSYAVNIEGNDMNQAKWRDRSFGLMLAAHWSHLRQPLVHRLEGSSSVHLYHLLQGNHSYSSSDSRNC